MYDLMGESKEDLVEQPLGTLAKVLLLAWSLLGMLPLSAMVVGYHFLPSSEWMSTTSLPGLGAGLVSAGLVLWLFLKGARMVPISDMNMAVGAVFAPIFGYLVGKNIVVIAGPMIFALVAGRQVELTFTVARADSDGISRCTSPLELEGLPLVFDTLCGVSEDFRRELEPGQRIVVIGRGTSLGVYAEGLRRIY
ncbi:hypothetical protein [Ensifer oleiphilus]